MSNYDWDLHVQSRVQDLSKRVAVLEASIAALEAAQPKPLTFPTIEPNRLDKLHGELQEWAASKKGNPC